jgi:hypothetical protein
MNHMPTQGEDQNIGKTGKDGQELKNMEEKYKREIE